MRKRNKTEKSCTFLKAAMTLNGSILLSVVTLLALAQSGCSLEISDFYDYERDIRLENGADRGKYVKLDTSINFFSDMYDHIYVSR